MSVKMWVIGGVYRWGNEDVVLIWVNGAVSCPSLIANVVSKQSGISVAITMADQLSGPTHVPCPLCGELQRVTTTKGEMNLGAHLLLCGKPATDEPKTSEIVAGDGYRILGEEERFRNGDEFLQPHSNKWCAAIGATHVGGKQFGLTYRRKLKYPTDVEPDGYTGLDEHIELTDTDEIWSFKDEVWKSAVHRDCAEFDGLPVVARRRVAVKAVETKCPEQEKGWRFLKGGESIEEGDEWWTGTRWAESIITKNDDEVTDSRKGTYRRRVVKSDPDPGDGWYLLDDSHIINEGDQQWSSSQQKWIDAGKPQIGLRLRKTTAFNWLFRRRNEKEVEKKTGTAENTGKIRQNAVFFNCNSDSYAIIQLPCGDVSLYRINSSGDMVILLRRDEFRKLLFAKPFGLPERTIFRDEFVSAAEAAWFAVNGSE